MNEIDKINELNRIRKLNENYAATPDFGTGSLLTRPEDTSIQGASEDFMSYLQNPTFDMEQGTENNAIMKAAASDRNNFNDLKGNGTPELPQSLASQEVTQQNTQQSKTSSKVPSTGFTSPVNPPVSIPQEDILSQLKAARAANEASMGAARQADKSTELGNLIMKSGAMAGQGIVNRAGTTNIKLDPAQVAAKEAEFAGTSGKGKLEALMQDYGIKKGIEDTKYSREKDTLDRNERIAARVEDNLYKDKMLEATKAKTKEESSAGQKTEDREFAKDFNTYTSSGRNKAVSSLNKLKKLVTTLEKEGDGVFAAGGGRTAGLPKIMRNRDSIKWKADAVSSANDFLKETFAGAISNEERQALAESFYNDELPNSQNVEILNRKIAEMEASLNAKDEKAKYFQENKRTLSGYSSTLTPLDSTKNPSRPSAKSSPSTGQIISSGGKRYKVINDNGDLEEVK